MKESSFLFPGQKLVSFEVPETSSSLPSSFMIGMKKGGSTLLAKVIRDLMPYSEKSLFEFPTIAFKEGLPWFKAINDQSRVFYQDGYVFGVFRWLPENNLLGIDRVDTPSHKFLPPTFLSLLRDPRDALVSLYYSDSQSHGIPGKGPVMQNMLKKRALLQNVTLDEYVIQSSNSFLRHYIRTLQVLALSNSKIIRYEDIIYDKAALVSTVAEAISAQIPSDKARVIAENHHQIPENESEDKHIRQVHPGNYRIKLKGETIEYLNDKFSVIINSLNYSL